MDKTDLSILVSIVMGLVSIAVELLIVAVGVLAGVIAVGAMLSFGAGVVVTEAWHRRKG
jgi:hypothetical protein